MKILHYIPTYAPAWKWGGPVRSVSGLCEALAQQGHEVTVFTTNAGLENDAAIPTDHPVMRNGVRVHYFPRVKGYGIASPALEQAVAAHAGEFNLVHVTAVWQRTGSAACRAAYRAGVPYVISPRGALGPYSWRRGRLKKLAYYHLRERWNLSHTAGFHYTSQMEARECEPFRFGRPSCIVPNPIDFDFWYRDEAAGAEWRRRHGIAADMRVLLYAGRMHDKKGLDLLPPVLRQCVDAGLPVMLVCTGIDEDGTGRRLSEHVEKLRVSDHFKLLPLCPPEELRAAYSGANLFVFPSLHENFGNVAVEAAACGCFVLASGDVAIAQELADIGCSIICSRAVADWVRQISICAIGERAKNINRDDLIARFSRTKTGENLCAFYKNIPAAQSELHAA